MVSIIIVTFNSATHIGECVRSIACACVLQDRRIEHEIIVIDNASSDATLSVLRRQGGPLHIISNDHNAGFSAACNQGIGRATGDKLLFINPDAAASPGSIYAMARFLDTNAQHVAVGPRVIDTAGRPMRAGARRLPSLWSQASQVWGLDRLLPHSPLMAHAYYQPWDHSGNRDVECLSGAAMLCRANVVRSIGGFDEAVPLYLDDIDICARLGAHGRLHYLSEATVEHAHNASGSQHNAGLIEHISLEARYVYLRKHEGAIAGYGFVAAVLLSSIAATVVWVCCEVCRLRGHSERAELRMKVNWSWAVGKKGQTIVLPRAK